MKQLIILLGLILLTTSAPILSDTKDSVTQSVYEADDNTYIYTYENTADDIYKVFRFTTEEIITCFTNEVT